MTKYMYAQFVWGFREPLTSMLLNIMQGEDDDL